MSNKFKNIMSNIIGLIIIAIGLIKYLENEDLIQLTSLLVLGFVCFLYKVSETKAWLDKIMQKKIN